MTPLDFLICGLFLLIFVSAHWFTAKKFRIPAFASITALLLITAVGFIIAFPWSPVPVGGDFGRFEDWAFEILAAWDTAETYSGRAIWPGKGVWPTVIAGTYFLFGINPTLLLVVSAFVTGLTVLLIQLATQLLTQVESHLPALLYFVSSASFVLFSSILIRDPFFWLGMAFCLVGLGYVSTSEYGRSTLFYFLGTSLVIAFRPDFGVVVIWSMVGLALMAWVDSAGRVLLRRVLISLGLLAVLALSLLPTIELLSEAGRSASDKVSIYNEAHGRESVVSSFNTSISDGSTSESMSLTELVLSLGLAGLPNALLGPFPSEMNLEPVMVLAALSTIHLWIWSGLALYGFHTSVSARFTKLGMVVIFFGILLVTAATMTNYGSLGRFRIVAEFFLIPHALAGANAVWRKLTAFRFTRRVLEKIQRKGDVA